MSVSVHVCTTSDTDPSNQVELSVRDYVLSIWDTVESAKSLLLSLPRISRDTMCRSLQDLRCILMYASEHPSYKKRTPMNTSDLVKKWIPIIKGLATAHDKAPIDQCEFDMEQHLTPLLTAPVKQIREFYEQLVIALKADPQVPFFVWAWFESWGDVILKKAPDGEVKALKTALAAEIADLVEKDVQPDLKKAIAGALQWRSAESLEKIERAVLSGGKARMVGKESCLFLEVDVEGRTERVML